MFLGFFIVLVLLNLLAAFIARLGFFEGLNMIFGSLTISIFATGGLSYLYYRNDGIVSRKKINMWFLRLSLVGSTVIIVILTIYIGMARAGYFETDFFTEDPLYVVVIALLVMYIAFVFAIFLALFLILLFSFGIISVIVVVTKGATPEILDELTMITKNTTNEIKIKDPTSYWKYYFLQWFFHIPYIIDTAKLTLEKFKLRRKIPWKRVKLSVLSHLLFGSVIIIYVSFNPLLLTSVSIGVLYNLATNVVILVPFIIVPWFIYHRLRVRIKAPVRSFMLYHGVKHRMTRILVAVGTLLLFVRIGIQQVDILDMLFSFVAFLFFYFIVVVILSFTYYNYFENRLVNSVYDTYQQKYGKRSKE